jgi:uncharacterized protein YecT (DUF1311 family)
MRSYLPLFLASVLFLGGSQMPCLAQHMNAPGAPCQQTATNAETGQCFERAFKDADRELNIAYADIRKTLAPENRQNLENAQRAWLKYRDATCAAEKALYYGGTGAFSANSACLEAETRQRLNDLHATYDWQVLKLRP